MGIVGSNKKRSSGAGAVVWCAVLCLALLAVVEAAAAGEDHGRHCMEQCRGGRRGFGYIRCLGVCVRGVGDGRLAMVVGGGEGRVGAGTAEQCRALCQGRSDFGACYNECLYER